MDYILFDGACGLCNSSVRFIKKYNKNGLFTYISLQSEEGKSLLETYHFPPNYSKSLVFISNKHAYIKSTAILHILAKMGGGWKLFYLFRIIPACVRDGIYSFIAKRRR